MRSGVGWESPSQNSPFLGLEVELVPSTWKIPFVPVVLGLFSPDLAQAEIPPRCRPSFPRNSWEIPPLHR